MRRASAGLARTRQRGISLLVVMIVVLLSSLLALWAFRSSLVNEAIVGNDADYQRAFEAAQAMIQDAELDIQGMRADGTSCVSDATNTKICRMGTTVRFVDEMAAFQRLLTQLSPTTTQCLNGICLKRAGAQDFWSTDATMDPMTADDVGARYGEYTGALPASGSTAMVNPLLTERRASRGAWYWIEVMQYANTGESSVVSNASQTMALNLSPRVVYRITAVARGLKQGTQVVLQSTFARQKLRD
ncbi:MAG: pilus assembly protein [Pseudorhodoferax sp.]